MACVEPNDHEPHLVWCALPKCDSVTLFGSDGAPRSYPGYHGLAPDVSDTAPHPLGQDDNCDGYRDENINQLANPGFDDGLSGWGSDSGRRGLSTSTSNCRTSGHCAVMTSMASAESHAIGPGVFTGSVWVRTAERKDAPVNVAVEIVQYDYQGQVITSQKTAWAPVGGEYQQLTVSLSVLSRYDSVTLQVYTDGGKATIDDAWLGYTR
ncbi:MAG: hypothetical protein H6729_05045 [Deltaproteobacteria bacterium]|nr:hypothetical protein [Deltaproteobacteria bacterium]